MVCVGTAIKLKRCFQTSHRLDPTKKSQVDGSLEDDQARSEHLPILKCSHCGVSFASQDFIVHSPGAFRAHKAYRTASRPLMTSHLRGIMPSGKDDEWREFYGPVEYVHLDCWQYWRIRPHRTMFGHGFLFGDEDRVFDERISTWQVSYNQMIESLIPLESREQRELKEEQVKLESSASSRKEKHGIRLQHEDPEEQQERKRLRLDPGSEKINSDERDAHVLGLSFDVWNQILCYISVPDILRYVALVSKGMYQYTILDSMWNCLGIVNLSSSFAQIKLEHYPSMNYREAYQVCSKHVCEGCGDYCSNREYNYFYPLDCIICVDKCQKLPQFKLMNWTEATRYHPHLQKSEILRSMIEPLAVFPSLQFVACEIKFLRDIHRQDELRNCLIRELSERKVQLDNVETEVQKWIDEERRKRKGLLYNFIYRNETNASVVSRVVSKYLGEH